MATINDGKLRIECRVATESQLQRGLTAARTSLVSAGVDFEEAWIASTMPEFYGMAGDLKRITKAEWKFVEVWRAAEDAARAVMQVSEKHNVRLVSQKAHLRTEESFAELLKTNPQASQFPEPDAGPHYAIAA